MTFRPAQAVIRLAHCWFYAWSLIVLSWTSDVRAHLSGITDTSIQITEAGVRVIYTVPADNLLELEAQPASARIEAKRAKPPDHYRELISNGWQVSSRKRGCTLARTTATAIDAVASYQFNLTYHCPQGLDDVEVRYNLFLAQDNGHQNFTRVLMAKEELRMRFAFDKTLLQVPVASLLAEWGTALAPEFFQTDPNLDARFDSVGLQRQSPSAVEVPISWQADPAFIRLGVQHIWDGLDHMLFVVALLLVPATPKRLLLWISSFTLAHSITLGLSYYGILTLDPGITEPLVALTVLFVGAENAWLLRRAQPPVWTRAALVFVFGLVHGLGLSYQLTATGGAIPALGRLLYFNVGVELGQLSIVALLFWPVRRLFQWRKGTTIALVLSLGIAMLGLYWGIVRVGAG